MPRPRPRSPEAQPHSRATGPLTHLWAAAPSISRAAPGGPGGRGGERGPWRPRSARRGWQRPRGDVIGPQAAHTLRPPWLPPPARSPAPPAARGSSRPALPPPAGGGAASAARCQATAGGGAARPPLTTRRAPPPRQQRRVAAHWVEADDGRTRGPMAAGRGGAAAGRAPPPSPRCGRCCRGPGCPEAPTRWLCLQQVWRPSLERAMAPAPRRPQATPSLAFSELRDLGQPTDLSGPVAQSGDRGARFPDCRDNLLVCVCKVRAHPKGLRREVCAAMGSVVFARPPDRPDRGRWLPWKAGEGEGPRSVPRAGAVGGSQPSERRAPSAAFGKEASRRRGCSARCTRGQPAGFCAQCPSASLLCVNASSPSSQRRALSLLEHLP